MVTFVILFPHYGQLPMYAYPFLILGVLWLYLHLFGERFKNIGFRFNDFNWHAIFIGGVAGLLYAIFNFELLGPLLMHLGFKQPNLSDFAHIRHHFINFLLLILLASLIVIPYEEIIFRGFILNRLKVFFGDKGNAFSFSGLLASILFALYHWQEGWGAIITIFIFAVITTFVYRKFKSNLWYAIFFHITYDVFMLTMILIGKM
ncbi:MAG: CPBP family intramembrane glutamic endopeptidase [Mucilaginibacter sp.]